MSLKLIDPNRINEGFSAQPEDFCIDLQLTAFRKGKTVLLGEGKNISSNQVYGSEIDINEGSTIGSSQYLTTLYTEIGSSFDVIGENNTYQHLESLGITSVDIEFNSSNVPVVKMTLTDVRGRLFQQGNESPYSVFFQFPYPLFKLKAKGIYGKSISYDLHLIKFNTQFNSDFGGFEINCEFIGYTYAYLSDLLIGYTRAVPYTTVGSELMDTYATSFSEYQDQAFRLAEVARNYMANQTAGVIEQQKTEASNYEALIDSFKNSVNDLIKNSSREIEYSSDGIFVLSQLDDKNIEGDKDGIKTIQDLYTTKLNNDFTQSKINYDVTTNTSFNIENIKGSHTESLVTVLNAFKNKYTGKRTIVTLIDASKFFENIKNASSNLKSSIDTTTKEQVEGFTEELKLNIDVDPSIGGYFKMLCGHADLLWGSIHKISENILNDDARNKQFSDISSFADSQENGGKENGKILPFPDCKKLDNGSYVDEWIGNLASGGANIPEATFVEELIQGFLKAYKEVKELNEKLNSFENETNQEESVPGTLSYIPIHPMDSPISGSPNENPYADITDYDKLVIRLANRVCSFLALQNIDPENKKIISNDVLASLCDAEIYNIKRALSENSTLCNLIQTRAGQVETEVKFLGVKMSDTQQNQIMGDISKYLVDKNKLTVIPGIGGKITHYEYKTTNDKKDSYASFSPNSIKVPMHLASGSISNNTLTTKTNIPKQHEGKYLTITIADSISEFSVIENEEVKEIETLDSENKYIERTELKLNKKFGASYIETSGSDSSRVFFSKKPIFTSKESAAMDASYFTSTSTKPQIKSTDKKFINYQNLTDNSRIQINIGKNKYQDLSKKYSIYRNFRDGINNTSEYISDLPIMINNTIGSLFLSPLYIYQSAEIKAYLFLHSLPFNFKGGNPGTNASDIYFNKEIMDLLSERTKIIKGNYLWCALIGAILKVAKYNESNPKYRIVVQKDSIKLTPYDFRSKALVYDKTNNTVYLDRYKSILCEESSNILKDNGIGIVRNGEDFISIPPSILTLPDSVKEEFIKVFDDFLVEFNANILNKSIIFKGGFPSGLYDYYSNTIDIDAANIDRTKISEYSLFSFVDSYKTSVRQGDTANMIKIHGNIAKFSPTSTISKEIDRLVKKVAYLNIGHGSLFSSQSLVDKGLLNRLPYNSLYNVFGTITTLLNTEITNSLTSNEQMMAELKEMIGLNNSQDIRIKVYKDIKSIYEKWVNGDTNYKNLYGKFKFQNRHYKDISSDFKINPINMIKDLMENMHQPLISHISKVLTENNFNFLPTPSYINIHDMNEMTDLFKPYRWNESVTAVESMFVCMYIGEFSSKLELNSTDNYRSDGIKLTIDDSATSPQITQITAADFNTGEYDIPIIRVKYGDQNQSIFTKFGLDQSEFTITNESLVVTDDLTKNNGLSQNLYDIYVSRSYTLNLELLGNFTIQPFMYLYLENIPMFFGLYYIIKVSHSISGNTAITTIKAVRMRQTMTKMLDEESLYYSLFSIFKDAQIGSGTSGNYISGSEIVTGTIKSKKGIKAEVNKAYVDRFQSFIDELETFYEINVMSGYSRRANVNSPNKLSFHSWGAAIDINPSKNPNDTTITDFPIEKVRALAKKYGLGWGYDWKRVKDPMHFCVAKSEGGTEDILSDGTNVPNRISSKSDNGGFGKFSGDNGIEAGLKKYKPVSRSLDIAKLNSGKIKTSGISRHTKAFLDVIAFAEGTIGQSNNGYDYLIGDRIIDGWTEETKINHGGWKYISTAAGRYQFLKGTWIETCDNKNAPLTSSNQDNACAKKLLARLKNNSLSAMENKNVFMEVIKGKKLSNGKTNLENEWESFYKADYSSKTPNRNLNTMYELYIYALTLYK